MRFESSESSASLHDRQRIDELCQLFEQGWKRGESPRIEDFLPQIQPASQSILLRELLILEMNYRVNEFGAPLSDSQLCELHPQLMPDIAEQLKFIRDLAPGTARGDADTVILPPSEHHPTTHHQPISDRRSSSSGSRGLQIRCPHCSNPVELLDDARLESITCVTCGSAFSLVDQDDDMTRAAPTLKKVGRFELVSRLGIGGFGTVWKARDTELQRTVAVKIPRKGQLGRAEAEQFLREARSAAQLRHPNIVPVHEVGRDGDIFFIVSDLIRGVSLSDWLSGGTPSPREIAALATKVAEALHHAHQQGVIHRDIKPSNILLDEFNQPHVMDFGLAKREVGEITMTVDGQILGTPAYMAPEQAAGQGHWTDRRSDIYSLGVVIFRMLTGELPFRGNAQMQIHARQTEDAPDPRKLNRHLPRDLCVLCLKCLERDPNRRFATAADLADELGRFLRNEPIVSRPISRTERLMRWVNRNRALAAAAALTALLAVAGPTAAVIINRQLMRERELVAEKDHLLQQYSVNKEADAKQIAEITSRNDLLEGRSSLWKFWPPPREQAPRIALMTRIVDRQPSAPSQWEQAPPEQQVLGHLALAIMNDEAARPGEAIRHYELARDLLTRLAAAHPEETHYQVALADSHRQLARLRADQNHSVAEKEIEIGRRLQQQLAERHDDPRLRAAWQEMEFETAGLLGTAAGLQNLTRGNAIGQEFMEKVPSDPAELYRLACFLGGREPFILTRRSDAPGSSTAAPSTESPAPDAAPAAAPD